MSSPTIKLYFDYKSPFAYVAMRPAFALPERFDVAVRWIPYVLRIKGKGERSIYSEWKARYSYADARRWANRQGGFRIMGPLKVYDSRPALIGGLFAQERGFFRPYTEQVFARFFERRLEIDVAAEVAALIDELGEPGAAYLEWAAGAGAQRLEECIAEGHEDHVFGVPLFLFAGEMYWGQDRLPLLEERLTGLGLARLSRG
jgi:2-hydroxychromene-2-carboxylate isomerase